MAGSTSGQIYYARTLGTECLFGDAESVRGRQGGAEGRRARARYANTLTASGYKLDTVNFPATATSAAGSTPSAAPSWSGSGRHGRRQARPGHQ
jgi:hypothetical protein